jgi:hypothetical protein
MTKKQVLKTLHSINKHLVLASNKMYKLSESLEIPENKDIKKLIGDVEELIKIAEENV